MSNIDENYSKFYSRKQYSNVYPTEFVVRIFLSEYPNLHYCKPKNGNSVLDVGFGDGRNTKFLCDLSLDVYGVEISQDIVDMAKQRLKGFGYLPDLRVGRNSKIPFNDEKFDYILACHSCYYCDEGENIINNLEEYSRVLKKGGFLIASVPDNKSYIFNSAKKQADGTLKIVSDPYGNRNGYRLHGFDSEKEILNTFSPYFTNFSFGHASNDYFGIDERVFWIVCEKK